MKIVFSSRLSSGFTLIEILITISLLSLLLGFSTMNLLRAQQTTSLSTVIDQITTDMRSQQLKAMNGASTLGIYFDTNRYILFQGSTYNPNDSTNSVVTLDSNILLHPSPAQQVIFSSVSGESAQDETIAVQNTSGNEQKTITVNRYGVITSIQ